MQEVPALAHLNDFRQSIYENSGRRIDLSVLDESEFNAVAKEIASEFSPQEIRDAYLQLHLISELGGSHAPSYQMQSTLAGQGKNAGKYLLDFVPADPVTKAIDDNRSRESVAAAMYGNWAMLPPRDTEKQKQDTQAALERYVASTRSAGQTGMGLVQLGNSGIRANLRGDTPELTTAYVQNFNDIGRGWDRFSRDLIVNQQKEFGHYVPVEAGGLDASSNGRMQAMSANKATRDKVGVQGALRAFGPSYFQNKNEIRKAGDVFKRFS